MTQRANYFGLAPDAMQILLDQESYLLNQFKASNLVSVTMWELIKLRVSQINQCAYCIDMHVKDALTMRVSFERIVGLNAWRDTLLYSDVERQGLEWAELITLGKEVTNESYQKTLNTFGAETMVNLTIAINAINSWNRIAKTFKPEVGHYKAKLAE